MQKKKDKSLFPCIPTGVLHTDALFSKHLLQCQFVIEPDDKQEQLAPFRHRTIMLPHCTGRIYLKVAAFSVFLFVSF